MQGRLGLQGYSAGCAVGAVNAAGGHNHGRLTEAGLIPEAVSRPSDCLHGDSIHKCNLGKLYRPWSLGEN